MLIRDILNEADPKTKVKDKTKVDFDFAQEPENKGSVSTSSAQTKKNVELPGKKQSKAQTRAAASQVRLPAAAGDVFANLVNQVGDDVEDTVDFDIDDLIDSHMGNDDADFGMTPTPTPTKDKNALVAVNTPGQALANSNFKDHAMINWHELKNLPGYAVKQIRVAFRPLFQNLLGSELENISVSTTLDPTQPPGDIKKLIGFIGANGQKMDDFNLEAFNIDPEKYHIDKAMVYDLGGFRFLILDEKLEGNTNYYIYTAVKPSGTRLTGKSDTTKQIGSK